MAITQVTLGRDDSKERATNADSSSEPRMEKSPTDNIHGWSEKWQTIKGLGDPKNWPTMENFVNPTGPYIRKWNIVFIVSCVLAVLLDPLFLYIPTIKEDLKCVRLDKNLKTAALVFRSVTDLFYLLNIFFLVYGSKTCSTLRSRSCSPKQTSLRKVLQNIAKTIWESHIIIDILAVLPLPQVAIVIMFSKMWGSGSSSTRTFTMNFLVLVQYVPRVLRIYLSCKEFKKVSREETSIWLKGVLNFFMYILASHVLGALWYFFAIQRITSCWQHACRTITGCDLNNFDCHNHHTLRNTTFLDDLCPIDPADPKKIDFGIFLQVLQFGILGSANYPEKFSNCFWWGLRNLSSLGSNLQPSINTWENLFSAFISIIGLLLFLYLIGNLQTYMQLDTNRLESHRWDVRTTKKLDEKSRELELWLGKNGIPLRKKPEILAKILLELKEDRDVDVENILSLSILPLDLQSYMKSCMPLSRLKKVPLLQHMNEAVLREISECLKPRKYRKDDIIIEEDKPLAMVIFMVDGLVSIEKRGCSSPLQRDAGELYGEQLLCWPAWTYLPNLSNESAKAIGDVEVLYLMASDIESVGCKFKSEFDKNITPLSDAKWDILLTDHVVMLSKVPKLGTMDTQVLKAISRHLKPKSYRSSTYLINNDAPLHMMVFVTGGGVQISNRPGHSEKEYKNDWLLRYAGYFFGEELLDWVLDTSFPAVLPVSTGALWADNADVLVLIPEDLASVVSEYKSDFKRVITPPPMDLICGYRMHWLKKVPLLRDMDEAITTEICKYLKPAKYKRNDVIVPEDKPLAIMILILEGDVSIQSESTYSSTWKLGAGEFYGEQLLYWPAWTSVKSLESITAPGDVNALILMASDIELLGRKFNWDAKLELFDSPLMAMLKKVPKLGTMDTQILKAISMHLKPSSYRSSTYLVNDGAPLRMMVFVTGGKVQISNRPGYAAEEYKNNWLLRYPGYFFGEELLDWVLDTSFPAVLPVSTGAFWADNGDVLVLMAEDLASVVTEYRSDFSRLITHPTDLVASLGLYWIKKVPLFQDMDEKVLQEISKHMKHMSYSLHGPKIIEENKPLEMMLVFVDGYLGGSTSTGGDYSVDIGRFSGLELVHWITNWASHTSFPAKLPLSLTSVYVQTAPSDGLDEPHAEVLVLWADDLKRIVSEFRSDFMKQIALPIDSEGKLATLDSFTMLKKVPMLENMDDEVLKAICSHLKPMKYSDDTPDGRCMLNSSQKIDKTFFIISGLVSVESKPRSYRYSGNYFGEQLLEWVLLDASVHKKPRLESLEAFMCVGEVEVLVLTVQDLAKVASQFETILGRSLPADFLTDSL